MPGVYLALGSNLGDRQANIAKALRLLPPQVQVEAVSPLYESEPQPPAPPPDYLNGAARVTTDLAPLELLRQIKAIERALGREDTTRWAPRPIDLDIALYGDEVVELPGLSVPHPRLAERNFVLKPLLDLDPALVHPVTHEALSALLARVGMDGLRLYADVGWERDEA
ncbi:MAG TPA: 2-amino-4-hydroxy-6-hydroxymethyldihydropteridine diphosphokinase [Dehalococcoidia bacterium]|nr:2-amino-4-hydroxy-6-hydroxymethyldihydropteridine diphosphokinase [Dehalococcoidia bacterium]